MADEYVNYLGYASNLLDDRMKNSVPNPQKINIGRLDGYKLIFENYNEKWHGHFAHAAQCSGSRVWGVIWRITRQEQLDIYRQECVDIGVYESRDAEVTTPEGSRVKVFFITKAGSRVDSSRGATTADCRPSPQYKAVIVAGARENGLPRDYVDMLAGVPDNGYDGDFDFRDIKTNFDQK